MKLRIMTFNIQHGKNFISKDIELDKVAMLIQEYAPTIVGLNEVYGPNDARSCQTKYLATRLGYDYSFQPSIIYKGIPYGNAILSLLPIHSVKKIQIPDPVQTTIGPYETRSILHATFTNPMMDVYLSHFGLMQAEQEHAVASMKQLLSSCTNPHIVLGDMNMEPSNPLMSYFYSNYQEVSTSTQFTYPSDLPIKKIDYIFVSSDFVVQESKVPSNIVSDHLPIVTDILQKA